MYNQTSYCRSTGKARDLQTYQEVCVMKTKAPLNPDQGQLLTLETGLLLVAIGSLLASQPVVGAHVSSRTSRNLIKIGRKLLVAGKCSCDS